MKYLKLYENFELDQMERLAKQIYFDAKPMGRLHDMYSNNGNSVTLVIGKYGYSADESNLEADLGKVGDAVYNFNNKQKDYKASIEYSEKTINVTVKPKVTEAPKPVVSPEPVLNNELIQDTNYSSEDIEKQVDFFTHLFDDVREYVLDKKQYSHTITPEFLEFIEHLLTLCDYAVVNVNKAKDTNSYSTVIDHIKVSINELKSYITSDYVGPDGFPYVNVLEQLNHRLHLALQNIEKRRSIVFK